MNSMFDDRQGNRDAITLTAYRIGQLAALTVVAILVAGITSMALRPDHVFEAMSIGGGIAAVIAAYGGFLGAYSVYWRFDGNNAVSIAQAAQITAQEARQ